MMNLKVPTLAPQLRLSDRTDSEFENELSLKEKLIQVETEKPEKKVRFQAPKILIND